MREEQPRQDVVVRDIRMPFGSMVVFMVKWAIASIPALVILVVLAVMVTAGATGFFAALPTMGTNPSSVARPPAQEAVIENASGREMTRVLLSVGGQTFVKESIPDGGNAVFPFRVDRDATFDLAWRFADASKEQSWSGGKVPSGPMLQRHFMTVDGDGAVLYRTENK